MRANMQKLFSSLQWVIFMITSVMVVISIIIVSAISYQNYANVIEEKVGKANLSNTVQIGRSLEKIFKNLKNNSLALYQNESIRTYLMGDGSEISNEEIETFLLNKLAYEEFVYAIDIRRLDGEQCQSHSIFDELSEEICRQLEVQNGKPIFFTDVSGGLRGYGKNFYSYARAIYDIHEMDKLIGYEQLHIRKTDILQLMSNENLVENNEFYLLEKEKIVLSTEKEKVEKNVFGRGALSKLEMSGKSGAIVIESDQTLVTYYNLSYPAEWTLVNVISLAEVQKENQLVGQVVVVTVIMAAILSGIMAFLLSRSVIRPIKTVEASMKNIEEEKFKTISSEGGYREITSLVEGFNRMSIHLDDLVNQIYVAQIKERDAQINAMQAYINPHFLYNTLDTICWMSRMENAYETCHLLESLSKFFRLSIADAGKITTVERELEHIENYIKIQECRHADMIEFYIEKEEKLLRYKTIRFVLQPLVENAIAHGIEQTGENGKVKIEVKEVQGALVFIVSDDGVGEDVEKLESLLKHYEGGLKGMGLSNVNDRIKLYFGEKWGVYFEKNEPKGIRVIIKQPLIFEEEKR